MGTSNLLGLYVVTAVNSALALASFLMSCRRDADAYANANWGSANSDTDTNTRSDADTDGNTNITTSTNINPHPYSYPNPDTDAHAHPYPCGTGGSGFAPDTVLTGNGILPLMSVYTLPVSVQTNITNLGAVTAGTWNASVIDPPYLPTSWSNNTQYNATLYNPLFMDLGTTTSNSIFVTFDNGYLELRTLNENDNGIDLATETAGCTPVDKCGSGRTFLTPGALLAGAGNNPIDLLTWLPLSFQQNLTQTGTIINGTWQANPITSAYIDSTLSGKTLTNPTFASLAAWSSGSVFAVIVGNQIVLRTLTTNGISLTTEVTGVLPTANVATTLTGKTLTGATIQAPTLTSLGAWSSGGQVLMFSSGQPLTRDPAVNGWSLTAEVTGILPTANVATTLTGKTLTTATLVNPTVTTLGTNTTTSVFVTITPGGLLQTRTLTTSPISLTAEVTGVLPTANVATTLTGKTLTGATLQAPTLTSLGAWSSGGTVAMISSGQILTRDPAVNGWNLVTETSGILPIAKGGAAPVWYLTDLKASGGVGGTLTAGVQTRVLTTKTGSADVSLSLASNQFTLTAGTYTIWARAPAFKVDLHMANLYGVTDAAVIMYGSSAYAPAANNDQSDSVIMGQFVVASTKVYEIRHNVMTTSATNGGGVTTSMGAEVYTQATITKIA